MELNQPKHRTSFPTKEPLESENGYPKAVFRYKKKIANDPLDDNYALVVFCNKPFQETKKNDPEVLIENVLSKNEQKQN